jgi:hypothetical protein
MHAAAVPFLPPAPASNQDAPGGLLGMMIEAGLIDPSHPDAPASGGLPGLIAGYMQPSMISASGLDGKR